MNPVATVRPGGRLSDRLLNLLSEYHPLPLTVDDLVDELNSTRSTVHTLVGKLVQAGLVRRQRVHLSDYGPAVPHYWLETDSPEWERHR